MSARRILVIDDQPEVVDVVRVAFEVTTDWVIVASLSVDDAAAAAGDAAIDASLLDLSVAGRDPRAAVTRLGRLTAAAPVILLTAAPLADHELRDLGVAGMISKPFDPMRLAADISALLSWTEWSGPTRP